MKKYSLIIPMYNEKNIGSILYSIEKQKGVSKKDFEVILVDDGSDISCDWILDEYNLSIKYIKTFENKGRSYARNLGAKNADGELLIFSDADRILDPKFLYYHIKKHVDKNEVVIGDIIDSFCKNNEVQYLVDEIVLNHSNKLIPKYRNNYAEVVQNLYDDAGETNSIIPWITLFSANFSISKQLHFEIGGFDEQFLEWGYENIDYGYRLYKNNIKFIFSKKAINYHIYHSQNRTVNKKMASIFYEKYGDEKILEYFEFIKGELSLKDLSNNFVMNGNLFFNPKNLGKKITKRNEKK